MSKHKRKEAGPSAAPVSTGTGGGSARWWWFLGAVAVLGAGALALLYNPAHPKATAHNRPPVTAGAATQVAPNPLPVSNTAPQTNAPPLPAVNTALMVTVELDFGAKVPSIAAALPEIERRYQPDDGQGRTFAILDAYGEPTPQGKLHLSMHLSMEKAGTGALVSRRTGEVLWQSRIIQGTNTAHFSGKNLLIYVDDGTGKTFTVDGSKNPPSLLAATLKEGGLPIHLFWPEGAEREITFLYSACGCPVKVMAKRVGDKLLRTKELPVIFPDDPGVVAVINGLMGW
jgi:hypothetical protein